MIITLATRRLQHFTLTSHISSQLFINFLRKEAEADFAHSQFLLLSYIPSIQCDRLPQLGGRQLDIMVGQQHYVHSMEDQQGKPFLQ